MAVISLAFRNRVAALGEAATATLAGWLAALPGAATSGAPTVGAAPPAITLPHSVMSLPQLAVSLSEHGHIGTSSLTALPTAPLAPAISGVPQMLSEPLTWLVAFAAIAGLLGLHGLADQRLWRWLLGGVDPLRQMWLDWQVVGDFIYGFLAAWAANNGWFLRPFMPEPFAQIDPQPGESPAIKAGRFFGNLFSIVQGIIEFNSGAGMLAGGGLFCAAGALAGGSGTLVTCPIAAPALAAGGVLALHGTGTAIAGAIAEGELLARILFSIRNGGKETPGSERGGIQVTSKTLYNRRGIRVDVENPNPGQRPGQVHIHVGNEKYIYDPATGTFRGAPARVQRLLEDRMIQEAVREGVQKYLGIAQWRP